MTSIQLLLLKCAGGFGLLLALYFGYSHWRNELIEQGHAAGKAEVQALWDADKATRKLAEDQAVKDRLQQNADLGAVQLAISSDIQRKSDEDLRKVRASLDAERLRKPTAICGKATTGTAQTAGTGSSNDADPEAGLLQRTVEARIRELIWETEVVASAARSCQAFVRANGFYTDPPRTETVEPKDPNPSAGGNDANSKTSDEAKDQSN